MLGQEIVSLARVRYRNKCQREFASWVKDRLGNASKKPHCLFFFHRHCRFASIYIDPYSGRFLSVAVS